MRVAATHPLTDSVRIGRPEAVFDRLDAIGVIKHLAPHESLVLEGDSANRFHRVLSGTIAGYKATSDGRRQIIAFFFPGDLVGLTVGEQYAYGAEALDRTSVCSVPRTRMRELSSHSPTLHEDLLAALDREIGAAQERLLWLGRKTARERIACFLLECAHRCGTPEEDGSQTVPLPMSQLEIGDYLGLASETVSRALAQLARDGAIEVLRPFSGVVIRDRRRLEAAMDEGPEPLGTGL
ncbi:MAG: helix-turn-helix domain-containing protein [Rhodospirillales bacterium]|nr:helix-turn-helix domain-containing protein [Rhodospirillales bacterium]MDE0381153.1 helix-turn-helix domain-containing protein [Rhodospirillales bacterium]